MRRFATFVTLALVSVALVACGGKGEQAPGQDATLLLDFTPNAIHAGIYSALARGFDEAEGVTLKVEQPSSSSDAVKLLKTEEAKGLGERRRRPRWRSAQAPRGVHDVSFSGSVEMGALADMAILRGSG